MSKSLCDSLNEEYYELKNKSNMKKRTVVIVEMALTACLYTSCTHTNKPDVNAQIAEVEKKYQDSIRLLKQELDEANGKIEILSFPADQRLARIGELFNSGDYDGVKREASELKRVFPNAKENDSSNEYLKKIEAIEVAKKAEEERIKALGFKAFKDNPTVKFDNVTYSFSGFTYGRTFTFEYVLDVDEYSYEVADKNSTYILASLSISTKENYASNPRVYACELVDGKLKEIDDFRIEYASYNTYGASIGNYSETSHDFSKVSSVKYKMAAQIPQSYTSKPIVIIVRKTSGYMSGEISIDEVRENYEVIK